MTVLRGSPPGVVVACWAGAVVAGAALLVIGPTAPRREPAALSPYSLAAHLRRVAGPEAKDVRVNGVYGSGRAGAWQFVAHITWVDATGGVRGGSTTLPQRAGQSPFSSDLDDARLRAEHRIGWSVAQLDVVLDRMSDVRSPLAMIELEIAPIGSSDLVECHGTAAAARCTARRRDGSTENRFVDRLIMLPSGDALSVRRASTTTP